jgi:hypothetical protein
MAQALPVAVRRVTVRAALTVPSASSSSSQVGLRCIFWRSWSDHELSSADTGALAVCVVMVIRWSPTSYSYCLMKIFQKAGDGLVRLDPLRQLLRHVADDRAQVLWLISLVPYVNFVALFVIFIDVAKSFGKSTGYGVGLTLLGFVFLPMLAFGKSTYLGPVHDKTAGPGAMDPFARPGAYPPGANPPGAYPPGAYPPGAYPPSAPPPAAGPLPGQVPGDPSGGPAWPTPET